MYTYRTVAKSDIVLDDPVYPLEGQPGLLDHRVGEGVNPTVIFPANHIECKVGIFRGILSNTCRSSPDIFPVQIPT